MVAVMWRLIEDLFFLFLCLFFFVTDLKGGREDVPYLKGKQKNHGGDAGQDLQFDHLKKKKKKVTSSLWIFPPFSPSALQHKHAHTRPCAATRQNLSGGSSRHDRLRRQRLLFPHWTT